MGSSPSLSHKVLEELFLLFSNVIGLYSFLPQNLSSTCFCEARAELSADVERTEANLCLYHWVRDECLYREQKAVGERPLSHFSMGSRQANQTPNS